MKQVKPRQLKTTSTSPKRTAKRTLLNEELERNRPETPTSGRVATTKKTVLKSARPKGKLQEQRNSAHQQTSDVTAQNWSAKQLARESVYEDETTIKDKMTKGKKVSAANARKS